MNNEFTPCEAEMIALHISNYQDSPSPKDPLKPELRESLCRSALRKIIGLTPMTVFTKQEYSIMFFAVQHFADVLHTNGKKASSELYTLCDKLYTKAGGVANPSN